MLVALVSANQSADLSHVVLNHVLLVVKEVGGYPAHFLSILILRRLERRRPKSGLIVRDHARLETTLSEVRRCRFWSLLLILASSQRASPGFSLALHRWILGKVVCIVIIFLVG